MSESGITRIDQDTFWQLIDQSKKQPGDPERWLRDELAAMGKEQAWMFNAIASVYIGLAYQYGLWTAATVIDEGCYSNDGFGDFRAWLVGQGKDVYMAALAGPDSLADGPNYLDRQFSRLAYAGEDVYQDLTGSPTNWIYEEHMESVLERELRRGITYDEGIGYPYEWPDIPQYVPRLYEKYLKQPMRCGYHRYTVRVNTWNPENPCITMARELSSKSKKVTEHRTMNGTLELKARDDKKKAGESR